MKPSPIKFIALFALNLALILSACTTTAEELPITRPATTKSDRVVSATGVVIPQKDATLSLSASGIVENLLVEKGETVTTGQVLLKLEGSEQLVANIASAELSLANAQYTLDKLYEDTTLMAAMALRTAEIAEKTLEDLTDTQQQEAQGIRAVAEAESRLEDAERNLAIVTKIPTKDVIDQAYSNLLLAENELERTLEDIVDLEWQLKKYSASEIPDGLKKPITNELKQALKGLEIKRSQDQLAYNRAETKYNDLLEPPDATDLAVAEAEYHTAVATLSQAQRDLERIQDGPDAGDVAVLNAQIKNGYRDYEIYSAGPDPDDVALVEARVANAEAHVGAAKEALADLELTAPFDGVISEVYINPSEWVAQGSPVLLLADLNNLQVETTDLSEIDVAKIRIGQTATITFDALPDISVEAIIIRISPKADTSAGVNFPVILDLSEIPTSLHWGMTAFINIKLE